MKTEQEIIDFVQGKGLVSVLGGNELPSLISAIMGREWKPSAKGFSGWLDWWSLKIEGERISRVLGNIERRNDVIASRVFKRSKTLVSNRLWPILDVIVRHQRELVTQGKLLSSIERPVLTCIETQGPIRTDVLRRRLGLEDKAHNSRFHSALTNLENYSLIVGAEDPKPERHLHANIWQTWKQRTGKVKRSTVSYQEAMQGVLEKTLEACVLAREVNIRRWFRWIPDTEEAMNDLLKKNKVMRAGPFLLSGKTAENLSHL